MVEKDKVEKGQDMYSPDLYDGNYAKCKTPSSISAADMYCYCSQRLHKSSFPYVKILVPAIFSLKTRWPSKNLTRANRSNFYPDSFPVARSLVIDRWNSELAYWFKSRTWQCKSNRACAEVTWKPGKQQTWRLILRRKVHSGPLSPGRSNSAIIVHLVRPNCKC